ncbi:hypothetical protein C1645_842308 [Glomus cerebriforme]|uniref:Uncharacterized protein n=1 Tax=Glomus cerebriforme TaxID=658196 RepID=A0A397RZS8_9GLOM|nr:hypothetical protein C1645_842308 [Glomus cerebriforme]
MTCSTPTIRKTLAIKPLKWIITLFRVRLLSVNSISNVFFVKASTLPTLLVYLI